jgi:rhamnose utilization protein RhaD (predicted bifunctional aldolase and dehydrogenase)
MNELQNFVRMSKYAGGRFDLTQASGGNTSVKISNNMLIKSSGFLLGDVETDKGFTKVDFGELIRGLKTRITLREKTQFFDKQIQQIISRSVRTGAKPSMEVFMHALLGKFVLHTHPIVINILTGQKQWQENLNKLFPQALLVEYKTPGADLAFSILYELIALAVLKKLEKNNSNLNKTTVIFLQNHGLVVSGNDVDSVICETENIIKKAEEFLNFDLSHYRLSTKICDYLDLQDSKICYLCCDQQIHKILSDNRELAFAPIFSPTMLIYNGISPLEIKNLDDKAPLEKYLEKYKDHPRVVLYQNNLFFVAANLAKARAMEAVFKANLLVLEGASSDINYLSAEEVKDLDRYK